MYADILKILRCPVCGGAFEMEATETEDDEIIEGVLECEGGHEYPVREGVIDFGSGEQEGMNQWSEAYEETDYESLDAEIEAGKTDEERAQDEKLIEAFVRDAAKQQDGFILDIASGRGMLLTRLVPAVGENVHVIATDLSFEVLKYDRLKLKKICPERRVSFIACDATSLPLADSAAERVVSFFGICNMMGAVEEGVREAARVAGWKLMNAFVLIREDSEGFRETAEFCRENDMEGAERMFLPGDLGALHSECFEEVCCNVEVMAIKDEQEERQDFLPYPGEWYAEVIYECRKG